MTPRTVTILIVLTLLNHTGAFAQRSKDTLVRYFNGELEPVKKKGSVFVGVIIRDPLGWNCLIYDDSMRVLVRGKYKDEDCKVKEGYFIYYYEDGKRASGGKFTNNIRVEEWKTWYPNGQTKDSVRYVNGTIHGGRRSYHENGMLAAEGFYKMGQMDSLWAFYHDNGKQSTRELYRNGKVEDLECFDTAGASKGMNCAISRPPALIGRYGGMQRYLADSLRPQFTPEGEFVEGTVTAQFTVTKEGRLVNFRIISTDHLLLSREVIRVFGVATDWYPAVSHGRNTDYTAIILIPFFNGDPRGSERFDIQQVPWDL